MSQRAQRLIEAARKLPVPEGTYAVGLGLLISGITAYGFQILAFKGLTKSEYAALNGLWILVFVVAPGLLPPPRAGSGPGRRRSPVPLHRRRTGRQEGGPRRRGPRRFAHGLLGRRCVRLRSHRSPVPRAGGAARLLRHRARHLRGAAHHARHALGERALRSLRHDPRRRGRVPHPPGDRALCRRCRQSALVRARARDPASARQPGGDPRRARAAHAGPRRRVVGALDQPHPALPGLARRADAELRGGPRGDRARPGQARAQRGRRLHRRVLHRPHPDPLVPGHPGRVAPEAGGALGRRQVQRLPFGAEEAGDDRRRRGRARDRGRGHHRTHGRPDPLRRQVQPRQPGPHAAVRGERRVHPRPDPRPGPRSRCSDTGARSSPGRSAWSSASR